VNPQPAVHSPRRRPTIAEAAARVKGRLRRPLRGFALDTDRPSREATIEGDGDEAGLKKQSREERQPRPTDDTVGHIANPAGVGQFQMAEVGQFSVAASILRSGQGRVPCGRVD
jgi:hypothetical protein